MPKKQRKKPAGVKPAKAPPPAIERQGLSTGPGRHRTKTQREADAAEVERLDRRGYSQREIASRIGVAPSQVCYDLKLLRKRYRDAQLSERSAAVAEKLAQYRDIRREAWEAWERSKDNKEKEITEKVSSLGAQEAAAAKIEKLKAIITTEGRLPGNEYLRTILETLQNERELQGLDAPKKQELSGPDGGAVPVQILEVILADSTSGAVIDRQVAAESSPGTDAGVEK
jgi:predicted transcriptional regulator